MDASAALNMGVRGGGRHGRGTCRSLVALVVLTASPVLVPSVAAAAESAEEVSATAAGAAVATDMSDAAPDGAEAALPDATTLIERMRAAQHSPGFRLRASVRIDDPDSASGGRSVRLMAKGRRTDDSSQLLIVGMWPDEFRGTALMVERDGEGLLGGFRFTPPDEVGDLQAADLSRPLFGTPLTAEDLLASFWRWPWQQTVGRDRVERWDCWVVESRPHPSPEAPFPLVRSCIAIEEGVPVQIDRYDAAGQRFAHVEVEDLVQLEDGIWAPAVVSILSLPEGESARLRFGRSDRDQHYPASDFTVEAVRALLGER